MAEFLAKLVGPWITFAQGAANHAHCVKSEERELAKPENQDLRDALFYINGRRYYNVPKLAKYEARRAAAPHPPKRPALKTRRNTRAREQREAGCVSDQRLNQKTGENGGKICIRNSENL
jgi:hypothetical protein